MVHLELSFSKQERTEHKEQIVIFGTKCEFDEAKRILKSDYSNLENDLKANKNLVLIKTRTNSIHLHDKKKFRNKNLLQQQLY